MRAQRSDRTFGSADPALAGRGQIKRHLRREAVAELRANFCKKRSIGSNGLSNWSALREQSAFVASA